MKHRLIFIFLSFQKTFLKNNLLGIFLKLLIKYFYPQKFDIFLILALIFKEHMLNILTDTLNLKK